MEYILLALDAARRRPAFTITGALCALAIAFGVFSVLDALVKRNIISLDFDGGYLYMANIRCADENPGILDMILQVTLGITGPVYFAVGAEEAVMKAKAKVGTGCQLSTVVQRKPYYRIVYPRPDQNF